MSFNGENLAEKGLKIIVLTTGLAASAWGQQSL